MSNQRPSVDFALLAGGGLVVGGLWTVAPLEVACGSGLTIVLLWLAHRSSWGRTLLVTVALATGAARSVVAERRQEFERHMADTVAPGVARCAARAVVTSSPVSLRGSLRWNAWLTQVSCDDAPGSAGTHPLLATLYGGPEDLSRGDEVEIVASLASPQRFWNESGGDPRPGEALRRVVRSGGALDVRFLHRGSGLLWAIDRARAHVRKRIDATFSSDLAPMARALVLGESDLAFDDDQSFRASGLSHLLAVSGMHLILVLALVVRTVEEGLKRVEWVAATLDAARITSAIGIPFAWIYAQFAGGGGSTERAAWMATAAMAARALGRKTDGVRAFGLSLVAMAIVDPLVAFDLSFTLSVGATAGLLAYARPLGDRLGRIVRRTGDQASEAPGVVRAHLVNATATTLAASLPCVPVVARFAPAIPLCGVLANLVAVPIGECAALPLCLWHALFWTWPAAERGCALTASGALVIVRAIARAAASPKLALTVPQPTSWQMVAIGLGAIVIVVCTKRAPLVLCVTSLLLFEMKARRDGAPKDLLRVTFLDVGQGDAAIVDLPDGEAMIVDGGGLVGSPIDVGSRVVAAELRARRRTRVVAAVLTHPHPDHFGGLASGLHDVQVGSFWDTGEGEQEDVKGPYADLLTTLRARGVPILRPDTLCGERRIGGARVEVLAPCPTFSSDRDPNDNSFVLRISFGRRAFLLVGDAQQEEEAILLQSIPDKLRADVLKVGHHGSRTSSSPAFLAHVRPTEAVISVGERNRFGHPGAQTLASLAAFGVKTWRTDRDGEIIVTTDGASLTASSQARESQDLR